MNQPIPTGPDLFAFAQSAYEKAKEAGSKTGNTTFGSAEETYQFKAAQHLGMEALTAAVVMLAECVAHTEHNDFAGWREKIGMTWLKECRSRMDRRPQCAERHTEDCAYADPPPEPKHVLLPVGTRVLVSDWAREDNQYGDGYTLRLKNPHAGRISGYDMHRTKYRWQQEWEPGRYASFDSWAFVDNRVVVHPDGPECPLPPQPVKREPTGPRIYVRNRRFTQGHIVATKTHDGLLKAQVQWYTVGTVPVWKYMSDLIFIADNEVERCPHGQTGDECGSGENQCEPCRQAEDAEGDAIEESMGLR